MTAYQESLDIDNIYSFILEDKSFKQDNLNSLCEECDIEDYRLKLEKTEGFNIYVFTLNDEMIGFLFSTVLFDECDILGIGVKKVFRNKGYGNLILSRFINTKKENGVRKINLEVESQNSPALGLYLKNGFVKVREIKNYYGIGKNAVCMVKEI